MDTDPTPAGYAFYELEGAITAAIHEIRGERLANRRNVSEREAERQVLNEALRPYGWRVSSIPNWRGGNYS